jgi:hypothetical protein
MALGVKYRCEWVDVEDVDMKVDILQEGYSSSVTTITPVADALTIQWRGDREDLYKPVKGAIADFNVWATSASQFEEFFDAYEKEYQMKVYYDGNLYWTGWVMVGEHIEEVKYPPYQVNFKAYDLGVLQYVNFDEPADASDSIIGVINELLADTGISLTVKERVNLYEDSMTTGQAYSPFTQAYMHNSSLFEDGLGYNCYEALERILLTYNAVLFQSNGVWNICRVPDMIRSHNYRILSTGGTVSSYGSEDTAVSTFDFVDRSALIMGVKTWKNLNFIYDTGAKNIIYNGNFDVDFTYTDYWTKTGAGLVQQTDTLLSSAGSEVLESGKVLEVANTSYVEYDNNFSVLAADNMGLYIRYKAMPNYGSGTGTPQIQFSVLLDGSGSFTYLQADGTWGATALISINGTKDQWSSGEIVSDPFPINGDLTIQLHDLGGLTSPTTDRVFWDEFSIQGIYYGKVRDHEDLSEEINANNILEPEDVIIYYGDSGYGDTGMELHLGSLFIAGSATSDWQSVNGSAVDNIQQLCADVYKAQHVTTAKRLQAAIRHATLSPEDVISYDDKKFFFSTFTKDFTNCVADGEWIEIKTGWGDDLVNGETMVNGYLATDQFDSFAWSGNTATISHSPYSGDATASLTSGPDLIEGMRYRVTISFANVGSSDLPSFDIGGTVITQGELSGTEDNIFEIVSDADYNSHPQVMNHASGDACTALEVTITIEEAYGI